MYSESYKQLAASSKHGFINKILQYQFTSYNVMDNIFIVLGCFDSRIVLVFLKTNFSYIYRITISSVLVFNKFILPIYLVLLRRLFSIQISINGVIIKRSLRIQYVSTVTYFLGESAFESTFHFFFTVRSLPLFLS